MPMPQNHLQRDARHLIDGQLVGGDTAFEVINPATGLPFALCPQATPTQLDEAVKAAGLAFQTWSWVLTLAGSAAIAAGIVVTFVTLSSGPEESAFFLAPAPNGVVFGWSFSR